MKEIIENPGCTHCRPVLLSFSCVFIYPSWFRRSLIIMTFHIISSHPYAFRAACHISSLGTPVVKKTFARDREVVSNICIQPFLRIDRNPPLCMLLMKVKYFGQNYKIAILASAICMCSFSVAKKDLFIRLYQERVVTREHCQLLATDNHEGD